MLDKINPKIIIAIIALVVIVYGANWYMDKSEKEALANMTVAEKKARFIDIVVPAVDKVYADLTAKFEETKALISKDPNSEELAKMREEYRADNNKELLAALKPHAKSVAIAQAAMESSWATSRFTRKANNLFGVWSFDEDEPRMAAGESRGEKTIYVKKYSSVEASVADYYRTLARGHAYDGFRAEKMRSNDPFKLVKNLDSYSEKGHLYGEELTDIIKFNKFTKFDD
jgi:Bax protein